MGFFSDLFGGGERDAAKDAAKLQQQAYADLAPWRQLGSDAIGDLSAIYLTGEKPFTASPGYDFRREEAERGLTNFLAARGLSGSGRAVRGAARLQDQLATEEYDRGFNRLASLAGLGGTAMPSSQQALTQQGSYGIQGAQARRSGYQDISNTLAGLAGFAFG